MQRPDGISVLFYRVWQIVSPDARLSDVLLPRDRLYPADEVFAVELERMMCEYCRRSKRRGNAFVITLEESVVTGNRNRFRG
jgi:hypothetical protein